MNRIGDIETHSIKLNTLDITLDHSGAAFIEDKSLLLVADLHLEKSTALARRTFHLLPPYDSRVTLLRLMTVATNYQPKSIIFLGDTWHDRQGLLRMNSDDRSVFDTLQSKSECIFITGNHDETQDSATGLSFSSELVVDDVILRHIPDPLSDRAEICGHLHPAIKINAKGRMMRRPCFIGSHQRLILPAFGALTGGLNCLDPAIDSLFSNPPVRYFALGQKRLYEIGARQLCAD